MPTYQYTCTDCGEPLEVVQSFSDDALTECPACGGRLRKVFSAVGIVFKGSGFYRNDSRGSENGKKAESTSSSSTNGDGSASSSDSSSRGSSSSSNANSSKSGDSSSSTSSDSSKKETASTK